MIHTFDNLKAWTDFAEARGHRIRELPAHPEDHLKHYYAGDDLWFFAGSGGQLMANNGYFVLDDSGDETWGEFMTPRREDV